jgi:heme oxygenase
VTLLTRLRTETRTAHARIEEAVNLPASLSTPAAYKALLARMYGFHAVFEEEAGSVLAGRGFCDSAPRSRLIVADLAALGEPADAIAALPRCPGVLREPSLPAALGAMYVVEGSMLGGVVIAAEVRRSLGIAAESGCSFFTGPGKALMARWAAFRERLAGFSSPERDDLIVTGALSTFERMQRWLAPGSLR